MIVSIAIGAACERAADRGAPLSLAEVGRLERAREYFRLRDRLKAAGDDESSGTLVARAVVHHAFNRLEESNAAIESALAGGGLPDSLAFRLRSLEVTNHLRLGRYRDGVAAADRALEAPGGADSAAIADLRNIRRIVGTLADVLPQSVVRKGPTTLRLERGRIEVTVGDSARRYIFDTGANLSTIMRSEALALGMDVREAGIDVGSSTDVRNRADLAVADRLTIGGLEFRHVVFLVFDDRLLTFPDGMRIPGIIGLPVILEMGEVRLRPAGELIVPVDPPARPVRNLAFDGHTPLTTVGWRGESLICRVDTGANTTYFYEPFYRRFKAFVDSAGRPDTLETGGVGGIRRLPASVLPNLTIEIGDTVFTLPRPDVITRTIAQTPEANYLYCNIGHDVFDGFREYIFNFRDMSFLLR